MTLPLALLAGGRATRLHPLTASIPKSLVDVAGKPFIIRQLESFRRQGISRVIICLGHLGAQIEDVVGDGAACGIDVTYSRDGETLLGTGGALRRALPLLGETFQIVYGDSYLPIGFGAVEQQFVASGQPALMTVLRNDNQWAPSNVLFRGGSVAEYDKHAPRADMHHVDYGLSILSASVLAGVPAECAFDLGDTWHDLSRRGLLAGHEVFTRFYEIGSPVGLRDTIEFFERIEA